LSLILLTVAFILFEASSFPSNSALFSVILSRFFPIHEVVSDIERYMIIKTLISLARGY